MAELLMTTIDKEELKAIVSDALSEILNSRLAVQSETKEDRLIKIGDVAKLLNVSIVTIHTWKKEGKIPFYRISNKVFFKESEILESLKKIGRGNYA